MNKIAVLKLLENYSNETKNENKQNIRDIKSFITNNKDYWSRNNKKGHLTVSAWIISEDFSKALLTHHSILNAWYQIGGHVESYDKTVYETIKREIYEESGLEIFKFFTKEIFYVGIHKIPKNELDFPSHKHFNIVFLILADCSQPVHFNKKEADDILWVNIDEIESITDDLMIKGLIQKTNQMLLMNKNI